MVEQLSGLVFPQLQMARGVDNKGIFIVGNYGTGKSHLMAVIAALAEHAGLLDAVQNARVKEEAASFAGSYKVLRMELGAVTRRLYYIVTDQLSAFLHEQGVEYRFPRLRQSGREQNRADPGCTPLQPEVSRPRAVGSGLQCTSELASRCNRPHVIDAYYVDGGGMRAVRAFAQLAKPLRCPSTWHGLRR